MPPISEQVLCDLAPTRKVRVAINLGNPVLAQRDPVTGKPTGITVDLAVELGRRLGVPVEFVLYDSAGKVFAAIESQSWDVAFLARDPVRAEKILFTPPYVVIEGTYLLKSESRFHSSEDLDQPSVRIAVGKGAAYDLYLTRALKHATLVRAETPADAMSLFEVEGLDALAGIRQALENIASSRPDLRVLSDHFMSIEQAMGTLVGRDAGSKFLTEFITEMKSCGFVAAALK